MTNIRARQPYARRPAPQSDLKPFLDTEFANIQRGIPVPRVRAVFADDTVQASDDTIEVDATAGPVTITLPPPDRLQFLRVTVIRVDDTANNVIVSGSMNGAGSIALQSLDDVLTVQSDGATWLVLSTLPNVFDVMRFGAVGDGIHDDSAAIQRAINAAHAFNGASAVSGGGTVVFPANTFICLSALTLYGNVSLRGAGMFQTMVWFTNHTDGFVLDLPAFPTPAMSITDMTVWGSLDAGTVGIRASNTEQLHLSRLFVGAFGVNLRNRDFLFTRLSGCQFGAYYGTQGSVVFGDVTVAPTFSTTLFLTDTYISAANNVGGCGLQVDRVSTMVMRGGAIESGGVGIRLGATNSGADGFYTSNVHITGVDMENCVTKYMEIGTAWTAGSYAVRGVALQNVGTFTSGSVNTPVGISIANTYDFRVDGALIYLTNPGTAAYDFVGTNNAIIDIAPATLVELNGGAYMRSNGVTLPHSQWDRVLFLPGENHRLVVDQAALGAQSGFAGFNSLRTDTIANNAELTLPNFVGRIVFIFAGAGWTLEYELQGGNNTTKLISDPNAVSSAVYNTPAKINIAWDGASNYKLQNKIGSTLTVRLLLVGSA